MTSGAEVVVRSLIKCGVTHVFGYPGGATIPLHQAFTKYRDKIRVILPRHEQAPPFWVPVPAPRYSAARNSRRAARAAVSTCR